MTSGSSASFRLVILPLKPPTWNLSRKRSQRYHGLSEPFWLHRAERLAAAHRLILSRRSRPRSRALTPILGICSQASPISEVEAYALLRVISHASSGGGYEQAKQHEMGRRYQRAAGVSALLMYLFDPDKGRRRIALARDRAIRLARTGYEMADAAMRDLAHRVTGSLCAGARCSAR